MVFRLGFARTRKEARQMVTHGHICVNGRRVDIPSFRVRAGELVSVAPVGDVLDDALGGSELMLHALDLDSGGLRRCTMNVTDTRVGQRTDYDKLVLEVETDGSIDPTEAVCRASNIINQMRMVMSSWPPSATVAMT